MFEKRLDSRLNPLPRSQEQEAFTFLLAPLTAANVEECAKLLNSEWPRSLGQRCATLQDNSIEAAASDSGSDGAFKLPVSLILVHQTAGGGRNKVIGHSSLSPIATLSGDCKQNLIFLQSLVVDKQHRGKGLGRLLMQYSEEYVLGYWRWLQQKSAPNQADDQTLPLVISLTNTRFDHLYLTTHDKQAFYESIGYERTEPVSFYSIRSSGSRCNQIMQALLSNMAKQNVEPPSSKQQQPKELTNDGGGGGQNLTWYRKRLTPN